MSKTDNELLLEVHNMSKAFYDRYGANVAVDNVSFNVAKGEILGLIGQSGSGKTTVANALVRLLTDVSGVVTLDGKVVSGRISRSRRRNFQQSVQKVFQDPHTALNEKRNVFSTIVEPLKANHIGIKWAREYLRDDALILQTFRLSLKERYLTFEKTYYNNSLQRAQSATKQVLENMQAFKTDVYASAGEQGLENGLNELFSLFFDPQVDAAERDLTELNTSYNELLEYFSDAQRRVQARDLPWDEVELVEAKSALTNYLHSFDDKKIGVREKELTKNYEREIKDWKHETFNILRAIYQQRRAKTKFARSLSTVATTNADYGRHQVEITRLKIEATGWKSLAKGKFSVDREAIYAFETSLEKVQNESLADRFANELAVFKATSVDRYEARRRKFEKDLAAITARKGEAHKPDPVEVEKLEARVKAAQVVFDRETIEAQTRYSAFEFKANESINAAKAKAPWDSLKVTNKQSAKLFKKHVTALFVLSKDRADKATKRRQLKNKATKLTATFYEQKLFLRKIKRVRIIYGLVSLPKLVKGYLVRELLLDRAVMNALTQVGLKPEHAYRYPHEFSGGQKQRINIARALILQPKLIIADEPIASLDVSIQAQIINLLVDLVRKRNIAMIFIGHDLSIIKYLADSLCVMHLGRIVERGYSAPIFDHPVHPYTKSLLDAIPKLSNADEPFHAVGDDLSYLKEYAASTPRGQLIEPFHLVLANDAQVAKWWGKNTLAFSDSDKNQFIGRVDSVNLGEAPKTKVTEVKAKVEDAEVVDHVDTAKKVEPVKAKTTAKSMIKPRVKRNKSKEAKQKELSEQIALAKMKAVHVNPKTKPVKASKAKSEVKVTKPKAVSTRSPKSKTIKKPK